MYQTSFAQLREEIENINKQSKEQLGYLKGKIETLENKNNSLEEAAIIAESKLQEYIIQSNLKDDEKAKIQHSIDLATNLAVLNRKCLFFEKQESDLRNEINSLRNNVLSAENNFHQKCSEMSILEKTLTSKLRIAENELRTKIDNSILQETQKHLDELTVKYKSLLQNLDNICSENSLENKILKETANSLNKEKEELQQKLKLALIKTHEGINEDALAKKLAEMEVNEITERQRANHIQNLYELVKEQLQKSEDRFREFEGYNKEIMHKNLLLQESLKDLQNQVENYVDPITFEQLQMQYTNVLKENESLSVENEKIKENLKIANTNLETYKHWSSLQEYEFLCLKHEIVDLQAATDDKTVIARLSSDVVNARLSESKMEQRVKSLCEELEELKRKHAESDKILQEEKQKTIEGRSEFEKRIR